ncbi:hypothetical protein ACVW17_003125 [Bradyrhizobium sp. USDA 4473]
MHDDWNGVDASFFRPARSFRRDWHYPATFDTQLLEIIPQTKQGRVHIATSCKAITEAHHVRSARRQDLFRPSFPCASVSCAPCSCDRNRNNGGYMARRTVSPIPSLLLFQQISRKLHTLHCCPPYHLFRKSKSPHRWTRSRHCERGIIVAALTNHPCIARTRLCRHANAAGIAHAAPILFAACRSCDIRDVRS